MTRPSTGPTTRLYGLQKSGTFHHGYDIGWYAAHPDFAISAYAAGVVTEVRTYPDYGLTVSIDHGGGLVTKYRHLASATVRIGDRVGNGQRVATMGHSGSFANGQTHLHFETHRNGAPVDPAGYLTTAAGTGTTTPLEPTTPAGKEPHVSVSQVKDAKSATVFLVNHDTGLRVGIASAYHSGLLSRFVAGDVNGMLVGELDICQGYCAGIGPAAVTNAAAASSVRDLLAAIAKVNDSGDGAHQVVEVDTAPLLAAIAKLTPLVQAVPAETVDALAATLTKK